MHIIYICIYIQNKHILRVYQLIKNYIIIQVINIESLAYSRFYLNHLQFFNVSTVTIVILNDKMLNEKFS